MEQQYDRRAQYWATIAVSLASLTASMTVSWSTPILPKFHNNETDIHLSDEEISWMVSIMAAGTMAGCLGAQYPAHHLGRRFTIMAGALPIFIGTIFVLTATKAWMLCVARFCWGLSCGMNQTVMMVYIAEISSKDIRGRLSVCNRYIYNFGAFLILAIGPFISYKALSSFGVVLPICYFIGCCFIPETPYFLLKQGKVETAREVLMKLNGYRDETILEEKISEMRLNVKNDMENTGSLRELVTGRKYRRALIIAIGLSVTRILCGSVALKQYVGRILQETSTDISVTGGVIIFGAFTFLSSVCASLLVDRAGRRPLLVFSFTATTIILAILGSCFFMAEVMNITPRHFGYINLFGNLFLCVVSTLGYDTVGFIILAEIFPLNVKSTAMSYLSLLSNTMSFISIRGYQVVKNWSGLYGVLWFFGAVSFVGAVFTFIAIPETKGKTLKEVQEVLQGTAGYENSLDAPVTNMEEKGKLLELKDKEIKELEPVSEETLPK